MASHSEVLSFAKELQSKNPNLTRGEMKGLLEARFIRGYSYSAVCGAVNNPMDWLEGLGKIIKGLTRLFGEDKDLKGIENIIEGVLKILY